MKHELLTYNFPYANCAINLCTNVPHGRFHTHSYDEIAIVLKGSGINVVDNNSYPIMRGDVFVIHGNQIHKIIKPKNLTLANIIYERKYFERIRKDFNNLPGFNALFIYEPQYRKNQFFKAKLHLKSNQIEKVSKFFELMIAEQTAHSAGSKQVIESVFTQLIVTLCRNYSQSNNPGTKGMIKISLIIDYIEKHFAKQITIATLCNQINMPSATFRRTFKIITGSSPIDYLIHHRIEKAAEMMRKKPSLHVIDVCMSSGFENTGHFAQKFREITGATPIQYLRKQREMAE